VVGKKRSNSCKVSIVPVELAAVVKYRYYKGRLVSEEWNLEQIEEI
jgi:hypothetical protein